MGRRVGEGAAKAMAPLAVAAGTAFGCSPQASTLPSSVEARSAERLGSSYRVSANRDATVLFIEASVAQAKSEQFVVEAPADAFVANLEVRSGKAWRNLSKNRKAGFTIPECRTSCELRYEFLLDAAAREINDIDYAEHRAGVVVSPPSAWLLRSEASREGVGYEFSVRVTPPNSFVTGVRPASSEGSYGAPARYLSEAPYSAFGLLDQAALAVGDRQIEVAFSTRGLPQPRLMLMGWLESGAEAVASYLQGFPVDRVLLLVLPTPGRSIRGKQLGGGGAAIVMSVGDIVVEKDLKEDWVLVHELLHLGLPNVYKRHLWLAEGFSTYAEPVVRHRAGMITSRELWRSLAEGLEQGQPEAGDQGLDGTPTWARIYWGGALFWFLVDVELRRQTQGAVGVEHAVRGILDSGGDASVTWPMPRILEAADRATGTRVMSTAYETYGLTPKPVDLTSLYRELGIAFDRKGTVTLSDTRESWIRSAIETGKGGASRPSARKRQ